MAGRRKLDWRHAWIMFTPGVLLVIAGFVVAYQFVKPAPPDSFTIATGSPGGAYYHFAERYRELLAKERVDLRVVQTAGSAENLRLLEAGEVDVAFVQGGMRSTAEGLEGLGSLYFEPLWVFHRAPLRLRRLGELAGRRVAVGEAGSGTRRLAELLLRENDLGESDAVARFELAPNAAADALVAGELDAIFLVAGAEAPLVRRLLVAEGVSLMSFERAQAYTRRHRFLSAVTLPRGALDLAADLPAADTQLIAPAASLVAGPEMHPALRDLLLQEASKVHREGGWFETPGQFPSRDYLDFPLSDEADRFYRYGPPLLQRFMPFWAASLVDRLKVMLLPLVVLLLPLFKVMSPLYRWRMRSRIYRWYRQLERVDESFDHDSDSTQRQKLLAELDRLESEVQKVEVPLSFAGQLYHLRQHIDLVREKLFEP